MSPVPNHESHMPGSQLQFVNSHQHLQNTDQQDYVKHHEALTKATRNVQWKPTKANLLTLQEVALNFAATYKIKAIDLIEASHEVIKQDKWKALKSLNDEILACNITKILQAPTNKFPEDDAYLIYIAEMLGLNRDLTIDLVDLMNDELNHRTLRDWIIKIMERNHQYFESESTFKEELEALGFSKTKAKEIENEITQGNELSNMTPLEYAEKYIDYQCENNALLRTQTITTPLNHAVDVEYKLDTRPRHNATPVEVTAVNKFKYTDAQEMRTDPELSEYLTQAQFPLRKVKYWYHATSYANAQRILREGVDCYRGRHYLDFSHGRGFYLTSDFELAYKWCNKIHKHNEAIIVFKLYSNDIFDKWPGMTFKDSSHDWKNIIKYYRAGKQSPASSDMTIDTELSVDETNYIFGPIADGGINPNSFNFKPKALKPHKYQLCLKSEEIAKEFYNEGKNIERIIFYCEGQTEKKKHKPQFRQRSVSLPTNFLTKPHQCHPTKTS